jgi:hypothetical protein
MMLARLDLGADLQRCGITSKIEPKSPQYVS